MKTKYKIEGLPASLCKDAGEFSIVASAAGRSRKVKRTREQFERGRLKYDADSQPRDASGRFRKILARLKTNLGENELEQIQAEISNAENADDAGDYAKATEAARKVIDMVDDIESGTLDAGVEKNLRQGAGDLGRVLAYLPLPQGDTTAKVRFSDLPPSSGRLINDMIDRVEDQINSEDAKKFTAVLKSFISGVRTMTADELSAELNKLLRLLS